MPVRPNVSYLIETQDGSVHKRHVDHIHDRGENSSRPFPGFLVGVLFQKKWTF